MVNGDPGTYDTGEVANVHRADIRRRPEDVPALLARAAPALIVEGNTLNITAGVLSVQGDASPLPPPCH